MKNKQSSKYFLNWTSGTGGDFLIAMLHLLYPFPHTSGVKVDERNMWASTNTAEDRLRMFHCEDVNLIQQSLNDMLPGELFQYHEYHTNPLIIPKDVLSINLTTSDIYEECLVAHLYNIKARPPENVLNNAIVRQSTHIPSAVNIDYKTLFDKPTNDIVYNILNMFGRSDAFSPAVVECLKAYHQRNLDLLNEQLNDLVPYKKDINTFQELCDHFEI